MSFLNKKQSGGFTLIELLVVVAIISLLSSVVLASLNSARGKARDAKRKEEMKSLQTALELYYNDNNHYPDSQIEYYGMCANCDAAHKNPSGPSGWIPDLAPAYISILPTDPLGLATAFNGYGYRSNGAGDYMLFNGSPESTPTGVWHNDNNPGAFIICNTTYACDQF